MVSSRGVLRFSGGPQPVCITTALVSILARADALSADNALTNSDGRAREAVARLLAELDGRQQ